ncbi:hypothetical protein [Aureimonas populi]|uniref:Uncharacterized protein n=1 Tax=Aureimonas populi TaxID=1701758 RepID=A0ABW5CQ10_9HYPH|nr:hypothetical protein [Aureimonas populi]
MRKPMAFALAFASALIALSAAPAPAGPGEPPIVRVVTIDGVTGPAYYSVVEKRFRFIAPDGADLASLPQD